MIVKIRFHDKGQVYTLPKLIDLERFSEEEVRQRMVDYGYDYHSHLMIVRIEDWDVDRNLSLEEGYCLLEFVKKAYGGDEYVVSHLLKRHVAFSEVMAHRYSFLSKDEEEAMVKVSAYYECDTLVQIFFRTKSWGNFMYAFIDNGSLLNTPKGFYWKVS